MSFWEDAGDFVAKASDVVVAPFTIPFDAVARNTENIPVVGTTFQGFSSLYKIPGAYLRGEDQEAKNYRKEFRSGFLTGGAAYLGAGATGENVGGALAAGTSTEGVAAAYDKTGKLDARMLAQAGISTYGDGDYSSLFKALSMIDQATGVPVSTSNPYVYATGALGGYSSGYDSSYLNPPDQGPGLIFYGAIAAAAILILASKGRK